MIVDRSLDLRHASMGLSLLRAGFHGPPEGPEPGGPSMCHALDGLAWRYRRGSNLCPPHSGFAELEAPVPNNL